MMTADDTDDRSPLNHNLPDNQIDDDDDLHCSVINVITRLLHTSIYTDSLGFFKAFCVFAAVRHCCKRRYDDEEE